MAHDLTATLASERRSRLSGRSAVSSRGAITARVSSCASVQANTLGYGEEKNAAADSNGRSGLKGGKACAATTPETGPGTRGRQPGRGEPGSGREPLWHHVN